MSREIYVGLSGASSSWTHLETLSNNLANVSTPGFKQGRMAFKVEGPTEHELGEVYALPTEVRHDMNDGALQQTGNPLDFAIQGRGYFQVQAPTGETYLTRAGRFTLNADNELVTSSGHRLLSDGGPLVVPEGEELIVGLDGAVRGSVSGEIGAITLVDGPVTPAGGTLWQPTGPAQQLEEVHIEQGAIERSNVDPLVSMVELVEATRYFEAYQKVMQASDEADNRLNRLGGA